MPFEVPPDDELIFHLKRIELLMKTIPPVPKPSTNQDPLAKMAMAYAKMSPYVLSAQSLFLQGKKTLGAKELSKAVRVVEDFASE